MSKIKSYKEFQNIFTLFNRLWKTLLTQQSSFSLKIIFVLLNKFFRKYFFNA